MKTAENFEIVFKSIVGWWFNEPKLWELKFRKLILVLRVHLLTNKQIKVLLLMQIFFLTNLFSIAINI